MDLERLIPNVRPRTHWEASDLGLLMARHWFAPLAICFFAPMAVVAVLGALFLRDSPTLFYLLLWWFKPLYERLPLHYLSRAIFSEALPLKPLLRHPAGALGTELLPSLTYRRLSLRRAFVAPVFVLERLSGERAAQRMKTLSLRTESFAGWLTILGYHVEVALALGAGIGLFLLLPSEQLSGPQSLLATGEAGIWIDWAFTVISAAVMVVFGPFYVACGFALYLNRRVALEAWDVEIAFRRLAARVSGSGPRPASASPLLTFIVLALCSLGVAVPETARAAPADTLAVAAAGAASVSGYEAPQAPAAAESKEVIQAIMEGPEFHRLETRRYPQLLRNWLDRELDSNPREPADLDGLLSLIRGLSVFFEALLWVAAVLLVIWLLSKLRALPALSFSARRASTAPPATLFGIELHEQSLPRDVAGTAQQLWQAGELREALSLLLRAQLLTLVADCGCRFSEGDTEQDCLREVQANATAPQRDAFARLVSLWMRVAYAHRSPGAGEFQRVCESIAAAYENADR